MLFINKENSYVIYYQREPQCNLLKNGREAPLKPSVLILQQKSGSPYFCQNRPKCVKNREYLAVH